MRIQFHPQLPDCKHQLHATTSQVRVLERVCLVDIRLSFHVAVHLKFSHNCAHSTALLKYQLSDDAQSVITHDILTEDTSISTQEYGS